MMNKKRCIVFLFFLLFCLFFSCARWRVNSLSPKSLLSIENNSEFGNIALRYDEFALTDLSFRVGIFDDKFYTADNVLKRVQRISSGGDVQLVIGNVKDDSSSDIITASFKFSVIGSFTVDRKDNIYVQNRLSGGGSEGDFSPSFVLVFDKKGKLQYTLGQNGPTDTPFYYIDSLFIDSEDRLFVVSHSFNTWNVYRYENKKRDFYLNLGSLNFQEKDGKDTYEGQIENVKLYHSGETILISVAFYHDKRLKYHKVYDYSITGRKIEREIVSIPDPKNVLFDLIDDKHMYFWNMDNKDLRLTIYNMDGHIVNNVQLNINDAKYLYSELLSDGFGRIFSYHASKNGVEIFRWD